MKRNSILLLDEMGSTGSKQNKVINDLRAQISLLHNPEKDREIEDLRQQLRDLKSIDADRDQIISRREVEEWLSKQRGEIDDFKRKLKDDLEKERKVENEAKYIEMQKQIDSLRAINKELEGKTSHKREKKKGKKPVLNKIEISQDKINEYVDNLLNDKNVNVKYLPDFVERKLYRNMINILMGLLQNMANSTEVKFMGHKFLVSMSPDDQSEFFSTEANDKKSKIDTVDLEDDEIVRLHD